MQTGGNMEIEFITQQVAGSISVRDEIIVYNHEEDMANGRFMVAALEEDGQVTLVGIGRNEGTVSVIYI
jgi:hypothetical protein